MDFFIFNVFKIKASNGEFKFLFDFSKILKNKNNTFLNI